MTAKPRGEELTTISRELYDGANAVIRDRAAGLGWQIGDLVASRLLDGVLGKLRIQVTVEMTAEERIAVFEEAARRKLADPGCVHVPGSLAALIADHFPRTRPAGWPRPDGGPRPRDR